ncbi:V/A-type H+-transporting ATPase subunit C [Marinitoga hydrogenitolerans DSM 16785]|uniref:V/A-type H+-transporting ATPase subunit C n=1 Tax=Marinitoga hydrogenitolerans (strain DSM 16785 / JCM 12826 / AT1271) TaxID=1122195 RepID=A0A1M4VAM3_MARH1|nr:V-type ATPase subunit [Marinitoga hydrogenitolerans]SHE65920.1 V/A-type H+-transporting ATPase subunit C [Marinitoga hydrogenitolerans DSM 16785]
MKFPALMAKIKSLNSKILNKEDFRNLINTNSVTEIAEYLKKHTHYNKIFENEDISKLHRRDIEILIRKSILSDFYNIYFYLPIEGQKFFKIMEKRFEIENIKFVLRSLHSEHSEYISKEKFFPLNHQYIDEDILASTKSFDDVLNILKNTPYKSVIDSTFQNYLKTNKIQYLLNAFDFWYFTKMKSILGLIPSFGKNLKKIFFIQMDLANIQWVYRAKVLFKFSTEEVLNFLMPISFNLSSEELKNIATAENTEDFINKISVCSYGKYFQNIEKDIFPYVIERTCEKILLENAKMLLSHTQNGFDVMSGYLYVREYEYKDLITLIEGKRYEIPNDKIKTFLLLVGD